MASGPGGTSALCRMWCDRQLAAEEVCHEPGMAGDGIEASINAGGESTCWLIAADGTARTEERQTRSDAARSFSLSTLTQAEPLHLGLPYQTAAGPALRTSTPPLITVLRL